MSLYPHLVILILMLLLILMHVSQEGVSKVEIRDLPAVWKERMLDSLGVTVPSDATGPLQDVHWSMGTYSTVQSSTVRDIIKWSYR